jgi:aminoglycoside phosphotransferase (APT) family kinase protein
VEFIASGRSADVFDLGDGRVLRRYRDDRTSDAEARLMRHVGELGYPVPLVYDAEGRDLVMEHVKGPTLFEGLLHEPTQIDRYGRLLGELHERLHRIPAPDWLRERSDANAEAGLADDTEPVVLHRDLHPINVILSERGPVVIDWEGAGAGAAALDVALTVVVTLGADLASLGPVTAESSRLDASRGLLIESFLGACGTDPAPALAAALRVRSRNPTLTGVERNWLERRGPSCLDRFAF